MSSIHQPYGNDQSSGNPINEPILHVIDFEDVALSPTGIQILQFGGKAVLRQHMPNVDTGHLSPQQVMHMFIDQVYWEEQTGGLIMCTEVEETSLCLPIPRNHWRVRAQGHTLH